MVFSSWSGFDILIYRSIDLSIYLFISFNRAHWRKSSAVDIFIIITFLYSSRMFHRQPICIWQMRAIQVLFSTRPVHGYDYSFLSSLSSTTTQKTPHPTPYIPRTSPQTNMKMKINRKKKKTSNRNGRKIPKEILPCRRKIKQIQSRKIPFPNELFRDETL